MFIELDEIVNRLTQETRKILINKDKVDFIEEGESEVLNEAATLYFYDRFIPVKQTYSELKKLLEK